MKFYKIKNRNLRRLAIAVAFPFVVIEYLVRSQIALVREARVLWNYKHP